jgi:hypothetical protein
MMSNVDVTQDGERPEITSSAGVILWQGKPLEKCSKASLIAAVGILHRTLNAVRILHTNTQRVAELVAALESIAMHPHVSRLDAAENQYEMEMIARKALAPTPTRSDERYR